jgi:putative RNA 2'-phosphotransferase
VKREALYRSAPEDGMRNNRVKASKFMAWALRHAAPELGLELDSQGWAGIAQLCQCAANHGTRITEEFVHRIVETDQKQRYAISSDGLRIRARFGHSLDVDLPLESEAPPSVLYHGTATRFLESVMSAGLAPRSRRFVHLSPDPDRASRVGRRHGRPVTLEVDAEAMQREGWEFFRAGPETWLVREVPARFLRVLGYESEIESTAV